MIIVKNRELLVPLPERYLGTDYDISSEVRQFQVPRFAQNGVDLSALTFRCDFFFADGTRAYDTITLGKEVSDEYIVLTWNVTRTVLQSHPGTLFIQLRAIDGEATVRWGSYRAAFYVERHLNAPGNYEGSDLSEIEQMEQDYTYFKSVIEQVAGLPQYVDEAEAWAVGERNGNPVASEDATYNNNSKYYADRSHFYASESLSRSLDSQGYSWDAEAWAVGQRDGDDVTLGDPAYHNNAKYYVAEAESWAVGTRNGEPAEDRWNKSARYHAHEADEYQHDAMMYKLESEAWAVGTKNGTPVASDTDQYQNSAKYWRGLSRQNAFNSEAYAFGKRDGVPVTEGDFAYHNNAKYYAGQAEEYASSAEIAAGGANSSMSQAGISASQALQYKNTATTQASNARLYAQDAEAYAVGTRNYDPVDSSDDAYHNNAKYYAELAASSTFQVPATASDVGKFLRVKTVAGGVVTEYELVDIA